MRVALAKQNLTLAEVQKRMDALGVRPSLTALSEWKRGVWIPPASVRDILARVLGVRVETLNRRERKVKP